MAYTLLCTFKYYVHKDPAKRRKLGDKIGRKSLISDETSNVLCEVAIRHDQANQGLTTAELSDKIQLVAPKLSYKQVTNYRTRTFRKKHMGRLKPNSVMPQQTSSRHSQCTVAQQWRWFQTYGFLTQKEHGAMQEVWTTIRGCD